MNARRCAGFTLAELLAVVAILAVIARIVIPTLAFNDDSELSVAAGETGNALRLARSEAVRSGRSVLVDTATVAGHIRLVYAACSGPGTFSAVTDPTTRRATDVAITDGTFTRGVTLSAGFKAAGVAYPGVVFDATGAAAQACDVASMTAKGTPQAGAGITLSNAGKAVVVAVDPPTGRVTWP